MHVKVNVHAGTYFIRQIILVQHTNKYMAILYIVHVPVHIVKLASKVLHNIHIEINVYFMQDF